MNVTLNTKKLMVCFLCMFLSQFQLNCYDTFVINTNSKFFISIALYLERLSFSNISLFQTPFYLEYLSISNILECIQPIIFIFSYLIAIPGINKLAVQNIVHQMLSAVEYIHKQGLMHRDLKVN